jgi:nicotinamide mononucleotide transporter
MAWMEILGFVRGAASVLLAVRENAWNWSVRIANHVFFLILFWKSQASR